MKFSRNKAILATTSVCAVALAATLAACAPQANTTGSAESQIMPQADEWGVVVADEWQGLYPREYASYKLNEANSPDSGKHDYLELYPALNAMYEGYAFALDYDEASSHLYTLDSVKNTLRTIEKEQLANCITCKTPQYTVDVNTQGNSAYQAKFNDVVDRYTEPISCYNCHENDPKELKVTNLFFANSSIGKDGDAVPMAAQVCGQCHNEYYFDPETKATTNPYSGLAAMTPEAILSYYDERDYKDWTHPQTGAPMLKAQHPEFETVYGGKQSHMAQLGYSCADCHMGTSVDEEGSTYVNHEWKSPLDNPELIEGTCSTCHVDLAGQVKGWQDEEEARVSAISLKIEDYIGKLAAAKDTLSPDVLEQAQYLHRKAQFFWDFVMVENSEGAHNPDLTFATLDKAEAAVDQGLALLA